MICSGVCLSLLNTCMLNKMSTKYQSLDRIVFFKSESLDKLELT